MNIEKYLRKNWVNTDFEITKIKRTFKEKPIKKLIFFASLKSNIFIFSFYWLIILATVLYFLYYKGFFEINFSFFPIIFLPILIIIYDGPIKKMNYRNKYEILNKIEENIWNKFYFNHIPSWKTDWIINSFTLKHDKYKSSWNEIVKFRKNDKQNILTITTFFKNNFSFSYPTIIILPNSYSKIKNISLKIFSCLLVLLYLIIIYIEIKNQFISIWKLLPFLIFIWIILTYLVIFSFRNEQFTNYESYKFENKFSDFYQKNILKFCEKIDSNCQMKFEKNKFVIKVDLMGKSEWLNIKKDVIDDYIFFKNISELLKETEKVYNK